MPHRTVFVLSPGPSRRVVLLSMCGVIVAASRRSFAAQVSDVNDALAALEARAGGRLGVCLLDTGSGRLVGQRIDERFAMCSTFKLPLAALVLRAAEAGRLRLDDAVTITKAHLVPYAPVVEPKVGQTLTLAALAEATQTTSDNAAANLLLARLGGPAGFTAALRELGDGATRLDRTEPALNLVTPGDPRDTTTPRSMALLLGRLLAGDALSGASRDRLIGWMVSTTTGGKRLRAGLPAAWRSGDKTGTAQSDEMTDKVNDIGITWPPGKAPVVITAYYDSSKRTTATQAADEAVLAEVGRLAAAWATA